jgi:hypothetical protein
MASKIIEFDVIFNYADKEDGIEIPLVLNANGQSTMTVGFVDTGCGACLFSNEIGMDLGIDIESGELAIGDGSASRIRDRPPIGAVERRGAPPERRHRLHVPFAVAAGRMDRGGVGRF